MRKDRKRVTLGIGFGAVAVLGLGTFALAVGTFSERLRAPFHLKTGVADNSDGSVTGDSTEALLSSTKDTDQDGLTDAQELQIYKTSPFLPDTDSDGIGDKNEIDQGTDPNCPQGQDCRAGAFPSAGEVENKELARKLYESTLTAKLEKTGIPGLTDAPAIRQFLREAGVSEEVLVKFSDAQLRKMFEEAAQAASADNGRTANPGGGPVRGGQASPTLQEGEKAGGLPTNPPPAAIRELLLKGGLDKQVLDKFTDAQILELYKETLKGGH